MTSVANWEMSLNIKNRMECLFVYFLSLKKYFQEISDGESVSKLCLRLSWKWKLRETVCCS